MPEQTEGMERRIAQIVALYQSATHAELEAGLAWYGAYGQAIAAHGAKHGLDKARSLALFAALSPQAPIARNWDNFKHIAEDGNLSRAVCLFPHMRKKAIGLLDGTTTVEQATRGDKVGAFYANLAGDWHRVTIDRHAIAAADGMAPLSNTIDSQTYHAYERAYQAAALLLDVAPAQVQAVVWIVWRRMKGNRDNGALPLVV